jgi:CRP-like cAMP-binding protein
VSRLADDLSQVPLFSGLNKRQLNKLSKGFKERSFGPGTTVVREGNMDGVGFFVIAEGIAKVSVSGSTVTTIGPGQHFGELAMITKQARAATVTAETPLRCLMMAFWDFRKFAKQNPDVSWKLLEHVVSVLTEDRARRAQAFIQAS